MLGLKIFGLESWFQINLLVDYYEKISVECYAERTLWAITLGSLDIEGQFSLYVFLC